VNSHPGPTRKKGSMRVNYEKWGHTKVKNEIKVRERDLRISKPS